MLECWNVGMLECWNIGNRDENNLILMVKNSFKPTIPVFHCSIIPSGAQALRAGGQL
jgi:hypothetical protein